MFILRGWGRTSVKWASLCFVLVATALVLIGCGPTTPISEEEKGILVVDSVPQGARVFLDGDDTDRNTPATFEVDAGTHTVRLTREGMRDWGPQSYTVAAGETVQVTVELVPIAPPEPQTYALGLELLQENAYRSAYVIRAAPVAVPVQVDLSPDFPPPGDQGRQGSCVGWAVAYALKSFQERDERGWSLTDEAHLMSPAFVYNQIRQPGGGAYFVDAFNILLTQGVSSMELMPYDQNDYRTQPSSAATAEAGNYKIAAWGRVAEGTSAADFRQEMKRHLASGKPIVVGVQVYPDFLNLSQINPVYDDSRGSSRGGHAIVVVGYDDSRSAFRIVNSWGTGWGLAGYGWIDYGSVGALIDVAYVVVDEVSGATPARPAPVSQADPGNGASGVALDAKLVWIKGQGTTSFDVYLGTTSALGAAEYQGSTQDTAYQGAFAPGTVYYWRVDARNAAGITPGPVWSFTTAAGPPTFGTATLGDQAYTESVPIPVLPLPAATGGEPPLSYRLTPAVPGLSFDAAARRLTGTPSSAGTYHMTYTAQDAAGQEASLTFTITVAADTRPTFGSARVADQSYPVNNPIPLLQLPSASGGNGTPTYVLSPHVPGLVFDDAALTLSGTPTAAGSYPMTHTARDADGDETSLTFTITVVPPDEQPTFTVTMADQTLYTTFTPVSLALPHATGGNTPLTYLLSPQVPGLVFDDAALTLSGVPTAAGSYPMTYTARDADGDETSLTFTITVEFFRVSLPDGLTIHSLAWDGSRFVGLAYDTLAVYPPGASVFFHSTDGIDWHRADIAHLLSSGAIVYGDTVLLDLAWGPPGFVAIGFEQSQRPTRGTVALYSRDGITWSAGTSPTGSLANSAVDASGGVDWVDSRFRAVGPRTMIESTDGITWTGGSQRLFPNARYGMAWDGSRFVAVGEYSISYSTDAANWTHVPRPDELFHDVASSGTRFVAVGYYRPGTVDTDGLILHSSDGLNWVEANVEPRFGLETFRRYDRFIQVIWTGTRFVALGETHSDAVIAYSDDGIDWKTILFDLDVYSGNVSTVAWGGGTRYVVAAHSGVVGVISIPE